MLVFSYFIIFVTQFLYQGFKKWCGPMTLLVLSDWMSSEFLVHLMKTGTVLKIVGTKLLGNCG